MITALAALLNFCFVGSILVRLPGRNARRVKVALAVCLGLALFSPSWDAKTVAMFMAGLTLSTGWVIRAARNREPSSLLALTGLVGTLAVLLWRPTAFTDVTLYFALDFLLACLLVAHALQLRTFRLRHEERSLSDRHHVRAEELVPGARHLLVLLRVALRGGAPNLRYIPPSPSRHNALSSASPRHCLRPGCSNRLLTGSGAFG